MEKRNTFISRYYIFNIRKEKKALKRKEIIRLNINLNVAKLQQIKISKIN